MCITDVHYNSIKLSWSLFSYLEAWVRQNCQLAFSRATTTTLPSSSCMGACSFMVQLGAGLQILEAVLSPSTSRVTCEAHSTPGRAMHSHSNQTERIVPLWLPTMDPKFEDMHIIRQATVTTLKIMRPVELTNHGYSQACANISILYIIQIQMI